MNCPGPSSFLWLETSTIVERNLIYNLRKALDIGICGTIGGKSTGAVSARGGRCGIFVLDARVIFLVTFLPRVDRIFHVGFQVGDGATVGTQKLRVEFLVVENGADAFEVPDVGARGDEQGLTGLQVKVASVFPQVL